MGLFQTAHKTEAYRKVCEDRVAVFNAEERVVLVVADGAGGIGNGDRAANAVVQAVKNAYFRIETPDQWVSELKQVDYQIGKGESTAVIVDVRPNYLCGASVGDSQAWLFDSNEITVLTSEQERKPLLGSQKAKPVAFEEKLWEGLIVIGTDGFYNYVKTEKLTSLILQAEFYSIPRLCIDLVRLPSGELWDDTGIIVCRAQPPQQSHEPYVI